MPTRVEGKGRAHSEKIDCHSDAQCLSCALFVHTHVPRARARHNRASAVPRSMQTLPTARCCIRSSKAVRHSWSRYTRPRGGRSSPREIRPSIVSMLARLASRSRAFHAPQKTPSTWCYRMGHRHRHLRPGRTAAQQPPALLLRSSCTPPALGPERRGGASRERRAAGYRHTVVSPRRPGRCVAAPPRRHAGLTTCCATRRSLSRARLSGSLGMAAFGAAPPLAKPTTRKRPPHPRARNAALGSGLGVGLGVG